jgi:hypothetical protein
MRFGRGGWLIMRVQVVFQFYLPYLLPRAPDWGEGPLSVEHPEFLVLVRARAEGEALFPDSQADRRLMELKYEFPGVLPAGADACLAVRAVCRDRMTVFVAGELSSALAAQRAAVRERFLQAAVYGCDGFLHYCRVALGHPFVRGLEVHYNSEELRHEVLTPYTETWHRADDQRPVDAYGDGKNSRVQAGMLSPDLGSVPLASIKEWVRRGRTGALPRGLVVDAEERIVVGRLYQGILGLAVACETASEEYLRRKVRRRDKEVKAILGARNLSFAEKRFDRVPALIEKRSLREEAPGAFEGIEDLYRARSEIMHNGVLRYRRGDVWHTVDQSDAVRLLEAARVGVEWIRVL